MCHRSDTIRTLSASSIVGNDQMLTSAPRDDASIASRESESRDPTDMPCVLSDTVRKRNALEV
jgi:hypothetical protein